MGLFPAGDWQQEDGVVQERLFEPGTAVCVAGGAHRVPKAQGIGDGGRAGGVLCSAQCLRSASWRTQYNATEWTLWDRFEVEGGKTLQELIDYFQVRLPRFARLCGCWPQPCRRGVPACVWARQAEHELEISMLSCGVSLLYSAFGMAKDKQKARLAMTYGSSRAWMAFAHGCPGASTERVREWGGVVAGGRVEQVVQEVTKEPIAPHVKHLVMEVCCDDASGEDVEVRVCARVRACVRVCECAQGRTSEWGVPLGAGAVRPLQDPGASLSFCLPL